MSSRYTACAPQVLLRVANRGQPRADQRGKADVAAPDDRYVLRHAQFAVAQRLQRTNRALIAQPTVDLASAALTLLEPIATPEAALWQIAIAGWAAALSREWEQLDQAIRQAYQMLDRDVLPRAARAGVLLALAILELEAGEPAGHAEIWINQAQACYQRAGELFGDGGTAEDLAAVKMSEGSMWQSLDGDCTRARSMAAC